MNLVLYHPDDEIKDPKNYSLVIVPVNYRNGRLLEYGLFYVKNSDVRNDPLLIRTDGGVVICCTNKGCKNMIGFRKEISDEILDILSKLSPEQLEKLGTLHSVMYYIKTPIDLHASEDEALEAVLERKSHLASSDTCSFRNMMIIHDPWYVIEEDGSIGCLFCNDCKP